MTTSLHKWQDAPHCIELFSGDIHIWCAEISTLSRKAATFYYFLDLDERKRANRFKFIKDREYFVASRGILKKILGLYLKMEAKEIKLSYHHHGKPYVPASSTNKLLHFNLSHSSDLALYIFSSSHEVGIDIEKVHEIHDFLDIAQRFFTKKEFQSLNLIPAQQQLECFFKCWTRKEAFIKAVGDGLSYPLDQFEVSLAPDKPAKLLNIKGDTVLAQSWSLYSITPAEDYVAAFIFYGNCKNLNFFKFDIDCI